MLLVGEPVTIEASTELLKPLKSIHLMLSVVPPAWILRAFHAQHCLNQQALMERIKVHHLGRQPEDTR